MMLGQQRTYLSLSPRTQAASFLVFPRRDLLAEVAAGSLFPLF